jgi:Mlc titration factor MtfA (ptsG expression regulator)
MLFTWLRKHWRRRLLARPFPPDWLPHLERNVPAYPLLTEAERSRLQGDLRVFLAEKTWEGCAGLEVTDEMKVTVSALACFLVLGLEHDYFSRVQSVLLYPAGFKVPERKALGDNLVLEGEAEHLGEAHYRGPVILSWAELLDDVRHPGRGRNLVFHEFAHQLDMLDGEVDGTPPLDDNRLARRWRAVMTAEYSRLVDDAEQGLPTLLDDYGTTGPGEFFAVATECFFLRPAPLRRRHRSLYELLRDYYRQDPASREHGEGEKGR